MEERYTHVMSALDSLQNLLDTVEKHTEGFWDSREKGRAPSGKSGGGAGDGTAVDAVPQLDSAALSSVLEDVKKHARDASVREAGIVDLESPELRELVRKRDELASIRDQKRDQLHALQHDLREILHDTKTLFQNLGEELPRDGS